MPIRSPGAFSSDSLRRTTCRRTRGTASRSSPSCGTALSLPTRISPPSSIPGASDKPTSLAPDRSHPALAGCAPIGGRFEPGHVVDPNEPGSGVPRPANHTDHRFDLDQSRTTMRAPRTPAIVRLLHDVCRCMHVSDINRDSNVGQQPRPQAPNPVATEVEKSSAFAHCSTERSSNRDKACSSPPGHKRTGATDFSTPQASIPPSPKKPKMKRDIR
jgi:hypothetical protein